MTKQKTIQKQTCQVEGCNEETCWIRREKYYRKTPRFQFNIEMPLCPAHCSLVENPEENFVHTWELC